MTQSGRGIASASEPLCRVSKRMNEPPSELALGCHGTLQRRVSNEKQLWSVALQVLIQQRFESHLN